MGDVVGYARTTAQHLLGNALPMRWAHVRAVGAKADAVAGHPGLIGEPDRASLAAAAWLHDIGYAPGLVDTGFHPLDGARWLRANGVDGRVSALVANHSCALIEADERGLAAALADEFPAERSIVAEVLVYCDLTTGPDGRSLDVVDRLADIRSRYGRRSVVGRFVDRAEAELISTVRRIEARLAHDGPDGPA
jgi:HD superfamily phosphodiesterase